MNQQSYHYGHNVWEYIRDEVISYGPDPFTTRIDLSSHLGCRIPGRNMSESQ